MQAVRTVYLCPTNSRGSRIKATAAAGSVTMGYDHTLNLEDNHKAAASALLHKLGWHLPAYGAVATGCLSDGSYCHVLTGLNDREVW